MGRLARLVSRVVRMTSQNGQGAVHLLGHYNPSQLMRQGNAAQRQKKIGTLASSPRPPICRANSEHKTLRALVAKTPNQSCDLVRGGLLTSAIEQNRMGRRSASLAVQPFEQCCLRHKDLRLTRHITPRPFNVIGQQPFGSLILRTTRRNRSKSQPHTLSLPSTISIAESTSSISCLPSKPFSPSSLEHSW